VLVAALAVIIAGIDQCAAERLAQGVHAICRPRMRSGAISMWRSPPSVARFHPAPRKKEDNKRDNENEKLGYAKDWPGGTPRRRTQIRVGQDCRGYRIFCKR
jgi:hypothetical protein